MARRQGGAEDVHPVEVREEDVRAGDVSGPRRSTRGSSAGDHGARHRVASSGLCRGHRLHAAASRHRESPPQRTTAGGLMGDLVGGLMGDSVGGLMSDCGWSDE